FDAIDTTWARLPGGAPIGAILSEAIRAFEPEHPEKAVASLTKARPLIAAMDDPLAKIKLAELDEAIALCAGLWVEAQGRQHEVAPASTLNITISAMNRSPLNVSLDSIRAEGIWDQDVTMKPANLAYNQNIDVPANLQVPAGQAYTQKYWLMNKPTADVYQIDDQRLIGLPDT